MSGTGQQAINLSRVQRCDQDWDNMPQVLGGRQCLHCEKRIVDMTRLSPAEIAAIHLASAEPVCGRYTGEQLMAKSPHPPRAAAWRRSPAMVSLLSLLLHEPADVACAVPPAIERSADEAADRTITTDGSVRETAQDSLLLRGRVVERSGEKLEGVPFVNVQVVGTPIGAVTDINGHFALDLSTLDGVTDSVTVEVVYIGYARQRRRIALHDNDTLIFNFTGLEQREIVYAVKYERPPLHKRVWWGVKGIFTGEH